MRRTQDCPLKWSEKSSGASASARAWAFNALCQLFTPMFFLTIVGSAQGLPLGSGAVASAAADILAMDALFKFCLPMILVFIILMGICSAQGLPLGSGMGSSAASAAAGAWAVNALFGGPLTKEQLVPAGLASEATVSGYHADNIAPALLGGFILIRCALCGVSSETWVSWKSCQAQWHLRTCFCSACATVDARDIFRRNQIPTHKLVLQRSGQF